VPVLTLFDPDNLVAPKGLGLSGSALDDLEHGVREILDDSDR
jgi:hypothetical protein